MTIIKKYKSIKLKKMTIQVKGNAISPEDNQETPMLRKPPKERPNIDHLIKRILIERRSQERKNLLILLVIVSAIIVTGIYIYN